jgi:hypothetical protein
MSKKIENLKIDLELINDRIAAFEGKSLNSERRELLNELYDCRTDLEKQIRGLTNRWSAHTAGASWEPRI